MENSIINNNVFQWKHTTDYLVYDKGGRPTQSNRISVIFYYLILKKLKIIFIEITALVKTIIR
jgi:hypothetical protein